VIRPRDHADRERLIGRQMQRDVAAIIDVGAGERRRLGHRRQNFLGDRSSDRRHRRDETRRMERRDRRRHPARDDAPRPRRCRQGARPQQRQFVAELVENGREPPPCRRIGRFDSQALAEGLDDEVDRAIVEMSSPVGELAAQRRFSHGLRPPWNSEILVFSGNLLYKKSMINLSAETEALARRLAQAKRLTVEDAIRVALEDKARAEGVVPEPRRRDQSAEAVAARRSRTDKLVATLAALPILDPRTPREIMDDLDAL
jgi:antitoxin VapB